MKNILHFLKKVIDRIGRLEWKDHPYSKQNWGVGYHMSPYIGKIKPAIAHILIKSSTRLNDKVFDPFCGIGTVPLESDLLNRIGYGNDLNPYAYAISKAKFNRENYEDLINYIDKIKLNLRNIDINECSEFMRIFMMK